MSARTGAATLSPPAVLPIGDTVRMPWDSAGGERVVRPALAVLYRMAVGPAADYYVPRFLRFEWTGRAFPSWHWPSFWLPGIWAFYRKLWALGSAGVDVPLTVYHDKVTFDVTLTSTDRNRLLKAPRLH